MNLAIALVIFALVSPQNQHPRKDVATIAKESKGAVVSIVMADKDGHPIAQGSGFVVSRDGRVVTNYHVIQSGSSAVIKLPDGAFFTVDGVLAFDKDRDVAVIKAHGNNFQTVTLGNSDRLQAGADVVAIGSPLSLESTVSNGIVSGIRTDKGRTLLQITAPISHGSSGGPLFNMAGEVVGITSAALVDGENLNFAVPINDARQLLKGTALESVLAFPDEPDKEPTEHAEQDPIILDESGATGFAEAFAMEPACAGLTLKRQWSEPGFWVLRVWLQHELEDDPNSLEWKKGGRTFISWMRFSHYSKKEHDCTIRGKQDRCPDFDKEFNVHALIRSDADKVPDPDRGCWACTPMGSLHAGVRAVCMLVKGGGGGQVK